MRNLVSFDFMELYKMEFADFAKGFIKIIDKYDLKALKLDGYYEAMIKCKPDLDAMVIKYGAHPLTEQMDKLWVRIVRLIVAFNSQIVAVEVAKLPGFDGERNMVIPFFYRIFRNLSLENRKTTNEKLSQLIKKFVSDDAFLAAANRLGFESMIAELRATWDEYKKLDKTRLADKAKRVKMKTYEKKLFINYSIRNFMTGIELAIWQYGIKDYQRLVSEVNTFTKGYSILVKTRDTKRKNKNDELEED